MVKSYEWWGYGVWVSLCMAIALLILAVAIETPATEEYNHKHAQPAVLYRSLKSMPRPATPMQKITDQFFEKLGEFNQQIGVESWLYQICTTTEYITVNSLIASPFLLFGWVFFRLQQDADLKFRGILPGRKQ